VKALGVTNAMLAGSIANAKLANSTISGIALGQNLPALTAEANHGIALSGSYDGQQARTISMDWKWEVINIVDVDSNNAASNVTEDSQANTLKISGSQVAQMQGKTFVPAAHPMHYAARVYRNGVKMGLEPKHTTMDGAFQLKIEDDGNGNMDVYIVHDKQANAKTVEFLNDNVELWIPVLN